MKKLNIVDCSILLFLIIGIIFVADKMYISKKPKNTDNYLNATYTFVIKGLREVSASQIPDNGEIFDSEGNPIGEIAAKDVQIANEYNQLSDGTFKYVENDSRRDVYLTVNCKGLQKEDGFYFNGKKSYGINSELTIDASSITFEGKILDITVE